MPALGKEMYLRRDAGIIKGPRINRAVADIVNGIIPRLEQECRGRLFCDVEAGIKSAAVATEVARIKRDGKIGAAAQFISRIDRLVRWLEYIAGLCDQITARREADHSDLVRIEV